MTKATTPVSPSQPVTVSPSQPAASPPEPDASLLDQILATASAKDRRAESELAQFLADPSPASALARWIGPVWSLRGPALAQHVRRRLNRDIARLDELLNRQVNAILHHPDFQRLEASWLGLHCLVEQADG